MTDVKDQIAVIFRAVIGREPLFDVKGPTKAKDPPMGVAVAWRCYVTVGMNRRSDINLVMPVPMISKTKIDDNQVRKRAVELKKAIECDKSKTH